MKSTGFKTVQNQQKQATEFPQPQRKETKRWYEALGEGKYCLACFRKNVILGYLHFKAYRPPFPCLKFEEIIVDMKKEPNKATNALVPAIKDFQNKYAYRKIFAQTPQNSKAIIQAFKGLGFKKTGAIEAYYFIDDQYVDLELHEYP